MGKPCIVGCPELKINYDDETCTANGITIKAGEIISIDGSEGTVYVGDIPTVEPKMTKDFEQILAWAQKAKTLGIRANADTPEGAKLARTYLEVRESDCAEQRGCLTAVIESTCL